MKNILPIIRHVNSSTLRGIVEVPPGIMGQVIVDQEVDKLEQELLAHQPVKREPAVNSNW